MKDYYSILGVERTATPDQIKTAYRKLASQHHPDKGGDTARFQEIQAAYATLSDPTKRQQYDSPRPQFGPNPFGSQFDFDSIFDMFGADLRHQRRSVPRVNLWISLKDVAVGGPRTVSMQTHNSVKNVEINIPQGIFDNDSVKYPGLGPDGQDLIVNYRVQPDSVWHRDGANLISERIMDIWDFMVGCELPITDILGKELLLTVPAGTQPGALLRAKGAGLPTRKFPGDHAIHASGDILIKLHARIPNPIPENILSAVKEHKGRA